MRSGSPTEVPPNFCTTSATAPTLPDAYEGRCRHTPPVRLPIGFAPVPTDKRTRQRAGREAKKAAEAKAKRRRDLVRNGVIVVVIAAVVVGSVYLISRHHNAKKTASSTTTTKPLLTTTTA